MEDKAELEALGSTMPITLKEEIEAFEKDENETVSADMLSLDPPLPPRRGKHSRRAILPDLGNGGVGADNGLDLRTAGSAGWEAKEGAGEGESKGLAIGEVFGNEASPHADNGEEEKGNKNEGMGNMNESKEILSDRKMEEKRFEGGEADEKAVVMQDGVIEVEQEEGDWGKPK